MAAMTEKVRYAQRVAYLGSVEKIRVALANEYSPDERLPPRTVLQQIIDKRTRAKAVHYAGRQVA